MIRVVFSPISIIDHPLQWQALLIQVSDISWCFFPGAFIHTVHVFYNSAFFSFASHLLFLLFLCSSFPWEVYVPYKLYIHLHHLQDPSPFWSANLCFCQVHKSSYTHCNRRATETWWRRKLNQFLISTIAISVTLVQQLLTRSKHRCLIGLGRSSEEEDDLELYHMVVMAKVEQAL